MTGEFSLCLFSVTDFLQWWYFCIFKNKVSVAEHHHWLVSLLGLCPFPVCAACTDAAFHSWGGPHTRPLPLTSCHEVRSLNPEGVSALCQLRTCSWQSWPSRGFSLIDCSSRDLAAPPTVCCFVSRPVLSSRHEKRGAFRRRFCVLLGVFQFSYTLVSGWFGICCISLCNTVSTENKMFKIKYK